MKTIFSLTGQTALVTGGSRGIGRATAMMLAEAGADISLVSRDIEACERVVREINDRTGRRAVAFECDVSIPEPVEFAVKSTLDYMGKIDILINNAGINIRTPIDKLTLDELRRIFDINVFGAFLFSRSVAAHMKTRRSGRIINIGSVTADFPRSEQGAYSSSKAALHSLTKTMAIEWAPYNVTVNAIAPGPVNTELNSDIRQVPELFARFLERVPLKRWSDPEEIGALAVYLASDASRFMTGSIVKIDGGVTIFRE